MSIEILNLEGKHCPVFICDVCHLRIEAGREGIVRWNPERPQDGFQHVHKGACDRRSDPKRECFWENLDVHLIFLRDNLQVSRAAWREAERHAGGR